MKTIIMKWEKKKKILNEKLDAFFSVASITIIIIIMIIIFNNCYILFVGSTILTAKMKYKKTGHPSINSFFSHIFSGHLNCVCVCVCEFHNNKYKKKSTCVNNMLDGRKKERKSIHQLSIAINKIYKYHQLVLLYMD